MTIDILIFSPDLKKVLLFLRNNEPAKNEYYSIGGRLNKDEDFIECAKRKVLEEIGVNILDNQLIEVGIVNEKFSNCFFSNEISGHNVNLYFALLLDEKQNIKLDFQHENYNWFDIQGNFHPYIQEKIKKSLKKLKSI